MTRPFKAMMWAATAASFVVAGLCYMVFSKLGSMIVSNHKFEGTVKIWIDTLAFTLGNGIEDMERKRSWALKFYLLLTMTVFFIIGEFLDGLFCGPFDVNTLHNKGQTACRLSAMCYVVYLHQKGHRINHPKIHL